MKNKQPQKAIKKTIKTVFFTSLIFISTSYAAKAQNTKSQNESPIPDPKWVIDFGGSLGLFMPYNQPDGEDLSLGISSMTSVQFNHGKHFFARFEVGELSVGFKSKTNFGTIKSNIDSETSSINIGLGSGYQYRIGKWQPYVYGGTGPSFIKVPTNTYNSESNTVSYSTDSSLKLRLDAGAGVNYYLSKTFLLLMEVRSSSMLNLPKNPSPNLNGVSLMVNVKITL